jgi:hypothetical protein
LTESLEGFFSIWRGVPVGQLEGFDGVFEHMSLGEFVWLTFIDFAKPVVITVINLPLLVIFMPEGRSFIAIMPRKGVAYTEAHGEAAGHSTVGPFTTDFEGNFVHGLLLQA